MFGWGEKKFEKTTDTMSVKSQVIYADSPFFIGLKHCNSAFDGYKNKVVYAVTNALVNKLLEVPIIAATSNNEKHAKYFRSGKGVSPEKLYCAKKLGITELDNHKILELFEKPNDYQTGIEFRRAFWFNKLLSGAGIIYVERKGSLSRKSGEILAMHVMPTNRVLIEDSKDWKNPVTRYVFLTDTGEQVVIDPKDVLYSGNWNPDNMTKGYDLMKNTASDTITKNNLNDMAQMAAFKNGGTGILFSSDTVTDGVGGVSDKMSPENMEALKETVSREYAGARNNKRMHFTNGFVNVTSFGDTLADLKLIEASEDDVKAICAIFGVSPIIIGEGKSNTESNVAQAYKSLVTNNVIPKLREFDQLFNRFLKDVYKGADAIQIYHDITEFAELMPNMELVMKVYGNNPAITLNELRILLGMDTNSDPLYDKSYIQSGFVPLEDAGFTNAYSTPQQNG